MRKVVPILIVLVLLFFVVLPRLNSNKPTTTSTPPAVNSGNQQPSAGSAPAGGAPKVDVPRASDAAVAAVVDEMLAAWDKLENVTATVESIKPEAAGHPGKTWGKGEYHLVKKDGVQLIHFKLTNELRIKKDDGNILVTAEILETYVDGRNVYSFISQPNHQQATKYKLNYDEVLPIGGPYLFRDLVSNYDLTLLPEEMKDNRATKVIKAKPKGEDWEAVHYFDKATGIRVEMVEMDAQAKASLTIKLPTIDTATPIDPEKFKPVVPEGVKLEDKSNDS